MCTESTYIIFFFKTMLAIQKPYSVVFRLIRPTRICSCGLENSLFYNVPDLLSFGDKFTDTNICLFLESLHVRTHPPPRKPQILTPITPH